MLHLEFSDALDAIGWTRAKAADELCQLPVTVRQWATGRLPIPDEVTVWLRPYAAEATALHARHLPPRRIGRPARS
ncbi:hypothetical protein [Roseomonas sp. 18066]|uniref:hypothetical protein n=1 Tax=Roseomonas sp. 18066 TaxID=2681412 RepID=UPI00135CA9BA|nr:hypothetical protein [Roseomonas sp. 18066]